MLHYNYCTTTRAVHAAVAFLRGSPRLLVDTEGKEIGTTEGCLSIISVGTMNAEYIFLFDVSALATPQEIKRGGLQPLLRLLSDPKYLKVVWDGRQDYFELREMFGCKMVNVLDLQIVELVSRWEVRGEGEAERRIRLEKFFGKASVWSEPERFDGLHLLCGMQRCVEENNLQVDGKDPTVRKLYKEGGGSGIWMARPIPDVLLHYAATDIDLIAQLYQHFWLCGWMNLDNTDAYLAKSRRYLETRAALGRVVKGDVFQQSPVVAEEAFDTAVHHWTKTGYVECSGCHLHLPPRRFEPSIGTSGGLRRVLCSRCVSIALKRGVQKRATDSWVPFTQMFEQRYLP